MTRIGFLGRTKSLYDTIKLFSQLDEFEIAFIWTCKDEPYYDFKSNNFEKLAKDLGSLFFYSSNINEFKNFVDADVVVSINFINIIPASFIEKFRFGIINAHAGDLPRYRGNACPNWAILNEESEIALSFHEMNEILDGGDLIKKEIFYLEKDTYIGEVYEWLHQMVPKGFVESVKMLIDGCITKKQEGKPLRTFPRHPEDARLDFHESVDNIYKLIRASSKPFSGAYAFLNHTDIKVTIFRAQPYSLEYDFLAVNGQLLKKYDFGRLEKLIKEVLKITVG